jgi:hypothetical protein
LAALKPIIRARPLQQAPAKRQESNAIEGGQALGPEIVAAIEKPLQLLPLTMIERPPGQTDP